MNRGFIPYCAKIDFGAHAVTYPIDIEAISREINRWVVYLTIKFRLVLILLELYLHSTIRAKTTLPLWVYIQTSSSHATFYNFERRYIRSFLLSSWHFLRNLQRFLLTLWLHSRRFSMSNSKAPVRYKPDPHPSTFNPHSFLSIDPS
jgi:hypothetical protein